VAGFAEPWGTEMVVGKDALAPGHCNLTVFFYPDGKTRHEIVEFGTTEIYQAFFWDKKLEFSDSWTSPKFEIHPKLDFTQNLKSE
jgi:hypothetical protein